MEIEPDGRMSSVKLNQSNKEHIPIGGQMNLMKLHQWWESRAVTENRKGAKHALRELGLSSTQRMLVNSLALSLNDCYWIKPLNKDLVWKDVSMFRNNFVDIFGDLTFDRSKKLRLQGRTKFRQITSQGVLQKKWCIDAQGNRFLVKGNWGNSYQQSLNEILASLIHGMQEYNNYTPYFLTEVDVEDNEKGMGCYSYNFCNENVEFISAWELLQLTKIKQRESLYHPLVRLCTEVAHFHKKYVEQFLWYEILTDYVMTNIDRHMNNIGLLRNPDTLQFIGFAPIYDTGNSMFFRNQVIPNGDFSTIRTNSFITKEMSLLKYVEQPDLINLQRLPSAEQLYSIYEQDIIERHCRIETLINTYRQKISILDRVQNGYKPWKYKEKM